MIKKYIFSMFATIGILIIGVFAFVLPDNPNEIIKVLTPMTLNRPLWLNIIIGGSFMYLVVLYSIYEKLNKESEVTINEK